VVRKLRPDDIFLLESALRTSDALKSGILPQITNSTKNAVFALPARHRTALSPTCNSLAGSMETGSENSVFFQNSRHLLARIAGHRCSWPTGIAVRFAAVVSFL
jgi:hypothetical protein